MPITGRATAQGDTLVYRSQSVRLVGWGFPATNYSLLSPLNHSGYSISVHSTRFREKPKHFTQFQLHFELGLLYNNANESYITTLGFSSGWSRYWHVTDRARRLRLLLGGSVDAGVSIYLKDDNTNNPLAHFFNLSISPAVLVKYRFKAGKTRIELGQQINVPVGSLVLSSSYSYALPYGFVEKDANFFDGIRPVSLGSFRKCDAIASMDVTPSLEGRIKWPVFRISYMFWGMNYRNGDFTVKSVDHTVLFGAIFHLFR
jgi:hypothetical protein